MLHRLILAHLVGDFVLQTRGLVARKRTPRGLAIHLGLVGLAMMLTTWDRLAVWWPWLLLILAIHGATDWAKIRLEPRLHLPPILPFLADQAVHVLTIAIVAALAGPDASEGEQAWWIASAYLTATFALSIALPLWLAPATLMRRPPAARLTIIVASALALTLAWRGLPILIPLMGLVLYQVVTRRLAQAPVTATLPIEFWSAVVVSASLGWGLA